MLICCIAMLLLVVIDTLLNTEAELRVYTLVGIMF